MATCSRCGNSITFRYVNGRRVPLHLSGGCIDSGDRSSSTDYSGYSRSEESRFPTCVPTKCPECGDKVFLVRYNGGSVWIDPPLGSPWYKHPCMDQGYIPSGRTRSSLLSDDPTLASYLTTHSEQIGIMSKATDKEVCEPAKTHGWGCGFPVTWQGWVAFVLYLALLALGVIGMYDSILSVPFWIYLVAIPAAFVFVCYLKRRETSAASGGSRPHASARDAA